MSLEATILCTPCIRDDKRVDAVKYCTECNENYCRTCLRQHIKQFASVSKQHKLLRKDEMPDWFKAASSGNDNNNCPRHPDNDLDSYCEDHELLCCGACVVIEHSSCEHVKDINQMFDEEAAKLNIDILLKDLEAIFRDFKDLEEARKKDQSYLRKTTAKSLSNVRELRKKMNNVFDELEKVAVEEINTESIKGDDLIEADLKQSKASLTLLEIGLKQLKISEAKPNKSLVESNMNILNGKKLLKDMKQIHDELQNKIIVKTIDFVANHHIEKYIGYLKSIGTCKRQSRVISNSREQFASFSVALASDEAVSDIQDAVQNDSGNFLLLDTENKKIKIIDRALNFVKAFDLKVEDERSNQTYINEPYGICCISDDVFAVSMVRDKTVNLYKSMGDDIQLVIDIPVGEYCRGIAYSKGKEELFVACGGGSYAEEGLGQIRVFSTKGAMVRSFSKDIGGKILSPQPMYLALSADERKLFIADNYKGIVTITVDGQYLESFTSSQLMEARGLCLDYNDNVIVCGLASNSVLRVYDDMKTSDTLVTESDGISYPQAIVYDSFSSRCLMSSNCSNEIQIFEL